MNYVFDNYGNFDDFCEFREDMESVDVEECVECHIESYYDEGNPIYECANFKRVYLFRYLATQFAQSDFVIKEHILPHIEAKVDLSAVSLGGGPAPEALALMNILRTCEGDYNLFFANIDCEASWEAIYQDLAHRFAEGVQNVTLKTTFSSSDVTSYVPDRKYDIVFISWMLSEMDEQDRPRALEIARDLVTPQGYILVADRLEEAVVESISTIVGGASGLELQRHGKAQKVYCGVSFPDDLKELFKVRLLGDIAYWVLQLPR
jgi:hypothetical protein